MSHEECNAAGIAIECADDPLADPHIAIAICVVIALMVSGGVGFAIFKFAMTVAAAA